MRSKTFLLLLLCILCVLPLASAELVERQTLHNAGDTWIESGASSGDNFGTQLFVRIVSNPSAIHYSFLRFHFNNIESGAGNITSFTNANLRLRKDDNDDGDICFYELGVIGHENLGNFDEGTATWDNSGVYRPADFGTYNHSCGSMDGNDGDFIDYDITDTLNSALTHNQTYFMFILNSSATAQGIDITSNESVTDTFRPNLTVTYQNNINPIVINEFGINYTGNLKYNKNVTIFANITSDGTVPSTLFSLKYPNGTLILDLFNGTRTNDTTPNQTYWTTSFMLWNNSGNIGQYHYWINTSNDFGSIANTGDQHFNVSFVEVNTTNFTTPLYETDKAIYNSTFIKDSNISIVNVTFLINGVTYGATYSQIEGGLYSMKTEIDINSTLIGKNNGHFIVNYTLFGNSINESNTSISQEALPFDVGHCNITTGQRVFSNMTFEWENGNGTITGPTTSLHSFEGVFTYWHSYRDLNKTFNISYPAISNFSICLGSPNLTQGYMDALITYDNDVSDPRNYYFRNRTLTPADSGENDTLYSMPVVEATETLVTVVDDVDTDLPGVHVIVERYDPGENEYRIASMGLTDENGQTIHFLRHGDALYRFTADGGGSSLLNITKGTASPQFRGEIKKITADQILRILPISTAEIIEIIRKINYAFTNSSNTVTLTYNDPSGDAGGHCLQMITRTFSNNTEKPATNCSTSSSGTLSLPFSGDGVHISSYWVRVNPSGAIAYYFTEIRTNIATSLGLDGPFFAFFVMGTLAMIGIGSFVTAILFPLLGAVFLIAIGVIQWSYTVFILLAIVALILLVRGKSR